MNNSNAIVNIIIVEQKNKINVILIASFLYIGLQEFIYEKMYIMYVEFRKIVNDLITVNMNKDITSL